MAIRVLMITPAINICGGIESFLMNYFRHIDRSQFVFDFLTHDDSEPSYRNEIEALGGKVYVLPPFTPASFFIIKKRFHEILSENSYTIVHCHMANAAFLYLKEAKKAGISVRILHSHQSKSADSFSHAIRNIPLIWFGKRYYTVACACSVLAGDFLFGNKPYHLVHNAIDYSNYAFSAQKRQIRQTQLEIADESTLVFLHTGRLCPQKNQTFLLSIFAQIKKTTTRKVHLFLVGDGEDLPILQTMVKQLQLEQDVTFLGTRKDIPELLSAADAFLFPSRYEGLSIAALEAQAAGLFVFASDTIDSQTDISGHLIMTSLATPKEQWAQMILSNITQHPFDRSQLELSPDFDITHNCNEIMELYRNQIGE